MSRNKRWLFAAFTLVALVLRGFVAPVAAQQDVGGFGGPWMLASSITDLTVELGGDADTTNVQDILFSPDGQIQYVVMDVTDYLDLDEDRLVLIAWEDFDIMMSEDYTAAPTVHYSRSDRRLRNEVTIDPDLLDDDALFVDTADLDLGGETDDQRLLEASEFTNFGDFDFDLFNDEGDNLGTFEDLILNLDDGVVRYAVMDVGGFLDLDENTVAVPWSQVNFNAEDNEFTVPVTETDLEDAPTFDLGTTEDDGFEDGWNDDLVNFWDETLPETGVTGEEEVADAELVGPWVLADDVVDMRVLTDDGDEISVLTNILFNLQGELRYAVINVTEYLDLDEDTVVAVPWDRLQVNEPEDLTTLPTVTYTGTDADLGGETEIDMGVFDDEGLVANTDLLGLDTEDDNLLPVEEFVDFSLFSEFDVLNYEGDELGDMDNLVLNLGDGTVQYALMGVGGFLGIGDETVAIRWELIEYNPDTQNFIVPVDNTDEETLANAPTIDLDLIETDGFSEGWNEETTTFWDEFAAQDEDLAAGPNAYYVLSSRIVEMTVVSGEGAVIASVEDILFNFDGQIRYLIFDAGAYLGLDEEYVVAVPWQTLEARAGSGGRTISDLILNLSDQELEDATEVDVGMLEEQDLVADALDLGLDESEDDQLLQASEFTDFSLFADFGVVNGDGEEVGEIAEVVLNLNNGTVGYAIVSTGDFLGVGGEEVPVPWDVIDYDADAQDFIIPVTEEDGLTLQELPTIDVDVLQDQGFEEGWNDGIDTFWGDFHGSGNIENSGNGTDDEGSRSDTY